MLGVGVFFTLSGYLITDLLVGQRDVTGHLRLGEFWLRRARPLLPALFVMLVVITAWVTLLDRSQLAALRGDVAAAATYSSNWWAIVQHQSYFSRFGPPPPPLRHLWSLAVEEQFYLVWPWRLWLGLRFVRGRYRLVGLTVIAAAGSAVALALLYQPGFDPTRAYEGTDLLRAHRPPRLAPTQGPPARAARDSGNLIRVLEATLKRPGTTLPTLLRHDLEDHRTAASGGRPTRIFSAERAARQGQPC